MEIRRAICFGWCLPKWHRCIVRVCGYTSRHHPSSDVLVACVKTSRFSSTEVCVCVFFPSCVGESPSDQGETCASPCSVFRRLHFVAHFSVRLHQPGSHRRGQTLGRISFIIFFHAPPLPTVFASIYYRERSSAVPSLVSNEVKFSTSDFAYPSG